MRLEFKTQLTGILARPAGQVGSLLKRNISKGINNAVKPAHNLVRDPIPSGASGILKSIKFDKATVPKQEARIYSSHPLMEFVEDDTKPHQIRPINAKALRFKVNRKVIFTKLVNHPGTKGKHSWVKSTKHVDAQLMNNISRAIDAALEGIAI